MNDEFVCGIYNCDKTELIKHLDVESLSSWCRVNKENTLFLDSKQTIKFLYNYHIDIKYRTEYPLPNDFLNLLRTIKSLIEHKIHLDILWKRVRMIPWESKWINHH